MHTQRTSQWHTEQAGLDVMYPGGVRTPAILSEVCFVFGPSKQISGLYFYHILPGACGSVVGCGTMLQSRRSPVRFPMRLLDFFNWPNPSSRTVVLGSTQPLTKMSTRKLPGGGGKGRPARKADTLTANCDLIVYKKGGPPRPVTGIVLPSFTLPLPSKSFQIHYSSSYHLLLCSLDTDTAPLNNQRNNN
jgi:hypothetical protein